ncbi:MAG: sigma-70 family RNA polymerase sigma factor [Acidobacteriota bacterium]
MNGQPLVHALDTLSPADHHDRLATLFDAHYDRLHRLARRLTPNADDAKDLVQETFLRTARRMTSMPDGFAREEAWLVRVLVNIRRDQWRQAATRRRHDEIHQPPALATRSDESAVIARATVWHALDALTPRRRAVIVLHELDDMPVPAIASLLGITAVTVRWHLSFGRRELARALGVPSRSTQ